MAKILKRLDSLFNDVQNTLKMEAEFACYTKRSCIRVVKVIAPKVKIYPKKFENIAYTYRIFPIYFIIRSL